MKKKAVTEQDKVQWLQKCIEAWGLTFNDNGFFTTTSGDRIRRFKMTQEGKLPLSLDFDEPIWNDISLDDLASQAAAATRNPGLVKR